MDDRTPSTCCMRQRFHQKGKGLPADRLGEGATGPWIEVSRSVEGQTNMCNMSARLHFCTFRLYFLSWPVYEGAHLPTAAAADAAAAEEEEGKLKAGNHSQKLWPETRLGPARLVSFLGLPLKPSNAHQQMNHPKNSNEATNETSSDGFLAESNLLLLSAGHPPRKKSKKKENKKTKLKEKTPKKQQQQLPSHRGHKKYHLPPIYMSLYICCCCPLFAVAGSPIIPRTMGT